VLWSLLYGIPLAVFIGWLVLRRPGRRGQWLGLLAALGLPTVLAIILYVWLLSRAG
jgi:hypothetical protein